MAEKHIGSMEAQYVVVSTAPDVCVVGIVPVPFDSYQDLSHQKSYVSNVRARGKPILTVGSVIAGTQSNAGKGVGSGTSLDKGDCEILTGVPHIKCKGKPIARHGSMVAMNNGNTVGTLYTQVNPANGPIPVSENVSIGEELVNQEVERQTLQSEAMQQMPDLYAGMGKSFINNLFELGRQLGTGGMQNGSTEYEERIAVLKGMGVDTSSMEKANELNQVAIKEISASPPLLEMKNESQEMGAKLENALEWVFIIKGLAGGGLKYLKWLRGRSGVGGVKVVLTKNTLVDGKWLDSNGLPLPVPPSVGSAGRVPGVLQTGGHTFNKSTANLLNKYFGENLSSREWGRALEALKSDNILRNDFHGRILDNGDYVDDTGNVIGNIGDYLP